MDLFQAYTSKRGEYSPNGISTESLGTLLRSKYALDAPVLSPDLSPEQSAELGQQTGKGIGEITKVIVSQVVKNIANRTIPKPSRLPFDSTAQHSTGLNIVDEVGAATNNRPAAEFSGAVDGVGRPKTDSAATYVPPLDLRYSAVSA